MVKQLVWEMFIYVSMQLKECEPNECMIYKVLLCAKAYFSVRAAASKGKYVDISDNKCWIYRYNRAGNVCGMSSLVGKLY